MRDELLEKQRIPFGCRDQTSARLVVEHGIREQVIDELVRLRVGQRFEHKALCSRREVRSILAELFAGDAHEQDRRVAGRASKMLDEVEERGLGPVEVVERQHERPWQRKHLAIAAERPPNLLRRHGRVVPEHRLEACRDRPGARLTGERLGHGFRAAERVP